MMRNRNRVNTRFSPLIKNMGQAFQLRTGKSGAQTLKSIR